MDPFGFPWGVGDRRFSNAFERVRSARDRGQAIDRLSDEEVIQALAAASRAHDPYLANVLATESMNRMRRSRTLAEHLGEGAFAVDHELRFTFVNPAMQRMLGREWPQLLRTSFAEHAVFATESGRVTTGTLECPVMRAATLGVRADQDGFLVVPGREERLPVNVLAGPILREGEPIGAVVAVRDLTEERRAQAEIAALRARLAAALEGLPHPALLIEADLRVSYANEEARALLGVGPGDDLLAAYARWDAQTWERAPMPDGPIALQAMTRGQRILGERVLIQAADGTERYMIVNAVPLPQGGVAASYIDQTEARQWAARTESLFRHQPEATFFVDRDGRITDVNPAVVALLREDPQAMRGKPFIGYLQAHELERATADYMATLQGETTDDWFDLVRADGTRLRARVQSIPMRIDDVIVGVHGVVKESRELD